MTGLFRAGWPPRPFRRWGRGWLRVGPFVVGSTRRWDESGAP